MLDLTNPPLNFIDDPYPHYRQLREQQPLCEQADGSFLVSSHQALDNIYKDTRRYSSDKKSVFKPRFGDSPLFEHHTTSLVFNDPPLHTRVRKIMVGAMTPKAIARMESGLVTLVDNLLDDLPHHCVNNELDIVSHFASLIPINVIGNLFDIPISERGPLRDWSLAILGALEPTLSDTDRITGDNAVTAFCAYLKTLVADRKKHPGNPETDVLTRLIHTDGEALNLTELLHNCIFTLNAGHETTTNLISNALCSLHENSEQKQLLLGDNSVMKTAVDEFLRFESPNQLGNRVTTESVSLLGRTIPTGTNLHLMIGAANRDNNVFKNADFMDLGRKPNKHLAFAGGPHSCLGLNLARMEGRIAIGRFLQQYPDFAVTRKVRSPRLRFRGFDQLMMTLGKW